MISQYLMRQYVASCDTAMEYVTNYCNRTSSQLTSTTFEVISERNTVEKRLCWVFMHTVARVNDGTPLEIPCEEVRSPTLAVTNDYDVRVHRFQIARRIKQRFTFFDGAIAADVYGIGRKPLAGDFKTHPSARRGLKEQVYDSFAPKRWYLLNVTSSYLSKMGAVIKQLQKLLL
jgi:hypothetical protein